MRFVRIILVGFLLISICYSSCRGNTSKLVEKRDTTITPANSFSELFLDSIKLESFITDQKLSNKAAKRIRSFYNTRNFQFAWFNNDGLAEQTRAFWNLHNTYINFSKDSTLSDKHLHEKMEVFLAEDSTVKMHANEIVETELQLTEHFFNYVEYAYAGKLQPEELQWYIPRKKVDALKLLDSLVAGKGRNIDKWEPVNKQYKLMNNQLKRYFEIRKEPPWNDILLGKRKSYQQGDSALVIKQVKLRLKSLGDYAGIDTSLIFTKELVIAVMQAQRRLGCKQEPEINDGLIRELNVPLNERIKQLLINMERMRWMPAESDRNGILVNIPDFKLHVFENSKKVFDMNIVVGKSANKTVIFNDVLKYIVFSPYWNVPPSIVRNEILPALSKNPNYLNKHNMEQTGYLDGLPVIRQRPGGGNALGKVKFVFPNSYNIYMHDTPVKSLFQNQKRAFSHGCIRLEDAGKMAEYLLRNQPEWTTERIRQAMNARSEKWVLLKEQLPVVITYFTAWVSRDGLLNFREDVYGNDKKMARQMFALEE